jgi:predicted transcriptional regulator
MKEENGLDEEIRSTMSKKFGFLPEELEAVEEFLKTNRNMLRFYLNEYSLHLNPEQQNQIAELSHETDLLVLKTSRIQFQAKALENEAIKALATNSPVSTKTTEIQEFKKQLNEVQNELLKLNQSLTKLVKELESENKQ